MDDSLSALNPFSLLSPTAHPASVAMLRRMLTNSVPSGHTRRAYAKAFDDFLALAVRTGQPVSRQLLQQYRAEMVDAGLGGSTINVRLSGVRKLVKDSNLLKVHQTLVVACCTELHCRALKRSRGHKLSLVCNLHPVSH